RTDAIEPAEENAIGTARLEPRWGRPLQADRLRAQKCSFGLPSRMRSEQSDEQSAEQLQEVKHPKARITHRGICASPDTIFGSHSKAGEYRPDHGMIRPKDRSRRGPQMSAPPDNTIADPEQRIADLERQL